MAAFVPREWFVDRDEPATGDLTSQLADLLWRDDQRHQAVLALAKQAGWVDGQQSLPQFSAESITRAVQTLPVELLPFSIPYREVDLTLRYVEMMLVSVEVGSTKGWLAVVKRKRRRIIILKPDRTAQPITLALFRFALCHALETPLEPQLADSLAQFDLASERRDAMRQAFLNQALATETVAVGWQLSRSAGADWWSRAKEVHIPQQLGLSILLQFGMSALNYLIALLIGLATFAGVIERGWLWLACILLLLRVPVETGQIWTASVYNISLISLIKKRMLHGVLRLLPLETQQFGTGQFLAWSLEAQSLNIVGFVTTNLIRSLLALAIVSIVFIVIGLPSILFVIVAWVVFGLLGGFMLYRLRYQYEAYHATMINGIMERLHGHQTRLMQESDWYGADDRSIAKHSQLLRRLNNFEAFFVEWMPASWLIGSVAVLAAGFVEQPDTSIALGFTVVLFTKLETATLTRVLVNITEAFTAWRLMTPIEAGANRPNEDSDRQAEQMRPQTPQVGQTLAHVQDLAFKYPEREKVVIRDANLEIQMGDRLLLEGPSGGGKSTLAYLLSGHYTPQKGLLFLWGMDKYAIGSTRWRQWVVYVPQFHQNHIISESLAFNLLMGRQWPPRAEDLEEAEEICRELGLGSLLERMPKGLEEPVGERGWNLSHGERSRVYIARALLQQADLIVLDESFASLDPETMAIAMHTVLKRAKTLLVIAHP